MTKITSSTILSLFALILLALSAPAVKAQTAPTAPLDPQLETPKELKDTSGVDCFDYRVDVLSLKDRNHRMYWKQDDCIRVHITSNPFLFKYDLKFNEQLIKEDDPLGAFGKTLGINTSSVGNSGAVTDTQADNTKKVALGANAVEPAKDAAKIAIENSPISDSLKYSLLVKTERLAQLKMAAPVGTDALQLKTLDDAKSQISKIDKKAQPPLISALENLAQAQTSLPSGPGKIEDWETGVRELEDNADKIGKVLQLKTSRYADFSAGVPRQLKELGDQSATPEVTRNKAETLRNHATDLLKKLSGGVGDPHAPDTYEPGNQEFEQQMLGFARQTAPLHAELVAAQRPADDNSPVALNLRNQLEKVHRAAQSVAFDVCRYKAERDNDFDSVRTHLLVPLNKVLDEPLAFGYTFAAVKREGPFGDPMLVQMALTRDVVHPFTTDDTNTPVNTTSSFTCPSDPTDMFENGADYNTFEDFFTDKLKKGTTNLYTRNTNAPKPTSGTTPPTTPKAPAPDPDANVVLKQPWYFGKARLVLSGGLTTGFLGKQEFQRSGSITGTTSQAVVGLKTDTRYRFTPMLYGHTLLYSTRHDSDAWYATFGVTANSDSKGTSPEFLLGGSRSFAQQRFFFTFGSYIGEKQKLDGGLQVGQVIPATLTGELPVTKSYHAGWGFGISYRFASTKDPQKDSSASTKQPSSGTKKSGN